MDKAFFDNWHSIGRTFIITILAYAALVIMLRLSGKRTLSKMNAFDYIITIAIGSSLSSVALNKNVALADGALAFLLLILMQFIITALSVRLKKVKSIVTSTPTLILYKGKMLKNIMKKQRLTAEDVYAKAREKGFSTLDHIDAIIMETTGDISIIPTISEHKTDTLESVEHFTGKARKQSNDKPE